jgi:phosphoribosylformylglycinamidine cyclo-ligase
VPPVFNWLAGVGGMGPREMLRTFNCGVGMLIAVAPEAVSAVIKSLTGSGETGFVVGELRERKGDEVTFEGTLSP